MRKPRPQNIEKFLVPEKGAYVVISGDRTRALAYGASIAEVLAKAKEATTGKGKPPLILGTKVLRAVAVFPCRESD